ncbi:hypothetical protein L218DRAFT_998503 [Marasmius fiardii PR-910]|nr:hypothetical protein L218DRAFT_998503 [Marasmius fiardii PR-910]
MESGVLYSSSAIIALCATLIKLPLGTFGDLYNPIHVQVAAIYPVVVLLSVNRGQSGNTIVVPSLDIRTTEGSGSDAGRYYPGLGYNAVH